MDERTQRVGDALKALGLDVTMLVVEGSTHTAEMAATAARCDLGQIVKTLAIYVGATPRLALIAGDRRLNDRSVADHFGVGRKQVKLATADQVLAMTGYEIGGVSPFGLPSPLETLIDESFGRYATAWVAGGTASAIFPIAVSDLVRATHATFAAIAT